MFKPLIPVISDAWSHEFNTIEHISTIHAKYGSKHLQQEVAENTTEKNKDQKALPSQDQVPYHVFSNMYILNFKPDVIDINYLFFKFENPLAVFISKYIPPPKFC
jgi:hypothetical protein